MVHRSLSQSSLYGVHYKLKGKDLAYFFSLKICQNNPYFSYIPIKRQALKLWSLNKAVNTVLTYLSRLASAEIGFCYTNCAS